MDKSMLNKQHKSTPLVISIVALLMIVPGAFWFFRNMDPMRESQPGQAEISSPTVDVPLITSTPDFAGNQENSFSVTSFTPTPYVTGNQDGPFSITPTKQLSRASTIPSSTVTDIQSRFFIVVSDEYTNSFEPVTPMPQNFPASLDEAEALAGFKILEPTFLPDGYVLFAIDYSAEDQHVGLLYRKPSNDLSNQVYFLQQRTDFSEHQSVIGTSAVILKLKVNDIPAEYVQGGFDDAGSTSTVDRLRWNLYRDLGRFRWKKDNYYFQISTGMGIDSTTLQRMAESLKQHMHTPNATPLPNLTIEETPSD
jgi:hypothetical protein